MAAKKKDLKQTVEQGIVALLESEAEPSEGRMKALALGIKMCALNAKLEESEYGDFFTSDERNNGNPESRDTGGPAKRANGKEHPTGKREASADA